MDTLLTRPGLAPEERLLILAKLSVWPGDSELLKECVQRCRKLSMSRVLLEEVLLQAILFCGFPRVINAFRVLQDEWPPSAPPAGGGLPPSQQRAAGDELFDAVYDQNSESVRQMLASYHAELHEFVLDTAYGRILSRPALQPRMRELMAVAILALTEQTPQLVAHGRGAMAFGATAVQLHEAIYTAIRDDRATERMVRRITP